LVRIQEVYVYGSFKQELNKSFCTSRSHMACSSNLLCTLFGGLSQIIWEGVYAQACSGRWRKWQRDENYKIDDIRLL